VHSAPTVGSMSGVVKNSATIGSVCRERSSVFTPGNYLFPSSPKPSRDEMLALNACRNLIDGDTKRVRSSKFNIPMTSEKMNCLRLMENDENLSSRELYLNDEVCIIIQ